jgi:hypothetical protein
MKAPLQCDSPVRKPGLLKSLVPSAVHNVKLENIRKAGDEVIGGIGVGGAPGGDKDEVCAQAGLEKISARLK